MDIGTDWPALVTAALVGGIPGTIALLQARGRAAVKQVELDIDTKEQLNAATVAKEQLAVSQQQLVTTNAANFAKAVTDVAEVRVELADVQADNKLLNFRLTTMTDSALVSKTEIENLRHQLELVTAELSEVKMELKAVRAELTTERTKNADLEAQQK